ncbi:MAG: tetratricopeptide repeat protein [Bacteroidota bacterium]
MKIKFLIAGLLGMSATTAFAQKYELTYAKEQFDKYVTLNKVKGGEAEADKSLVISKEKLDKAANNSKTAQLPQTYALKAAIYATYVMRTPDSLKSIPLFNTADSALKKAKELDVAGENKALISEAVMNLSQYQLNNGIKAYQAKNYNRAYKAFDRFRQLAPQDTTAIYYTAVAARLDNNTPAALDAYKQLLPLTFSEKPKVYMELSNIYLAQKDMDNALKMAAEGVAKYPGNADLRKREIEISLQTGKSQELVGKIQEAITNDPKNKTLYYYSGLTYTSFANSVNDDIIKIKKTAKDPAEWATLQAKKDDYSAKAAEQYKKALDIDPEYFEANYGMGLSLLNPAIDLYNAANQLPPSKQKEYNTSIAKATTQFEAAKPYLVKATELNTKSVEALTNLKNYYLGTKNTTEATATQKKIEALQNK